MRLLFFFPSLPVWSPDLGRIKRPQNESYIHFHPNNTIPPMIDPKNQQEKGQAIRFSHSCKRIAAPEIQVLKS